MNSINHRRLVLPLLSFGLMITATVCVAKPPNFVITIADDHGVHHSSVYGSPEFKTPYLQAMAEEGIRFDNAYVASPACAPSRAALFTGRMPYSNGIVGNHENELKPGVNSLLPTLLGQGYEVVFHGKVGHAGRKHFGQYVPDGVKILGGGGLQQTMTLDQVELFLEERPSDAPPLALFLGWTDTHTAWPPKEEARIAPEDVVIPPKIFDTPETRVEMTRYVEGAEDIDRRVGQTRELIAKHLDLDNTLVVYTSDHGMPWPFAKWSLYETGIRTPLIAVWPGKIKPSSSTDALVSWIDLMPTLIDLAGGTSPPGIDGRSFAKVLLGETDQHRDVIYATHKGDNEKNVYPIRSVRVGDWKYIRNLHPEFAYTTHTDVWATEVPRIDGHWAHAGHHWQSYIEAAKTDPEAAAFLRDYHSSPAEELYRIDKDPFEQNNLAALPQHANKLAELRAMVSKRMQEVGDDEALSGPPRLLKDFPLPTGERKVFDEVGGTIIMEMESTQSPLGQWEMRSTLEPFTGSSYLEFMGNNPGVGAPNSPLQYEFRINTPGEYWISIRSHKRLTGKDGVPARGDMCNDCYLRVEGDFDSADSTLAVAWLKTDMKFWGNAADLDWKNWSSKVVGEHDAIKTVRYKFKAGKRYRLVISGRAQRFNLDRIVITRVAEQRFNATAKESPLVEPERSAGVEQLGNDSFVQWQPLSLSFSGPEASETDDAPNPFLDYRLQVRFAGPSGQFYDVPGFFDGDGVGGDSGNQWKVRFTPDEPGRWTYRASLRRGLSVAVSYDPDAGEPVNLVGHSGTIAVKPRDASSPGFLKWGRLEYVGGHYLKFRDGPHWIRGGVDSPENFLAYAGFDNTPASHRYADHVSDWRVGDPDWDNGRGKAIIGALNSLAEQQVNSLYFLTMNIGGDGGDVWPWSGKPSSKGSPTNDNLHFDLSKMHQWEFVFGHAQRRGINLHFVFNEAEVANKKELDDGELGVERKLYYREIIARFGHHNALSWNLCEEYNVGFDLGPERVRSFADYMKTVDPYDHPISVHSAHDPLEALEFTFGDPRFSLASIQLNRRRIDTLVEDFREASTKAGRPLPISMDEFVLDVGQKQSWKPFDRPVLHRKQKIWPTLMSGGQLEFILEDLLGTESFKTPELTQLWKSLGVARTFMQQHLPFWEMEPSDQLVQGEATLGVGLGSGKSFQLGAQVFRKPGEVYVVYFPVATETGRIDLSETDGRFQARWFNPRRGKFEGDGFEFVGQRTTEIEQPPSEPQEDWTLLITIAKKPDQEDEVSAQPAGLVPMQVSLITESGMPKTIVKPGARWNFGPGALQTYRGWQYAAFWDANRQVSVARRELPEGIWECVSLGGYERTSTINRGTVGPKARGFGDGHEKVAMGISADGVIHLAFDHHVSTLHYRFSQPGVANQPSDYEWNESLFSPAQNHLGGPRMETVTYPNFVRHGDRMSLYLRLSGGSGSADSHFFEYESGRWIINDLSTSKLIDKHWSGGNGTVNAYPHTMFVHEGRRHLTWCWRDTPDARTCHDLCYAYSNDHGQTWRNNAGEVVAKLGSEFITADTPGIAVLDIPPGSSFVNGGSMTVDAAGDVHVLMKGPDQRPMMARRRSRSGSWTKLDAPTLGVWVAHKSNLWVVAQSGLYQVSDDDGSTFRMHAGSIEHACEDSKLVVDVSRHQHDETISVIGQTGTRVSVMDIPVVPNKSTRLNMQRHE